MGFRTRLSEVVTVSRSYETCPNCDGALLTKAYKQAFGQCKSCYEREHVPLNVRIQQALR